MRNVMRLWRNQQGIGPELQVLGRPTGARARGPTWWGRRALMAGARQDGAGPTGRTGAVQPPSQEYKP